MSDSQGEWVQVADRFDWVPAEQPPPPSPGTAGRWHVVAEAGSENSRWEWFPADGSGSVFPAADPPRGHELPRLRDMLPHPGHTRAAEAENADLRLRVSAAETAEARWQVLEADLRRRAAEVEDRCRAMEADLRRRASTAEDRCRAMEAEKARWDSLLVSAGASDVASIAVERGRLQAAVTALGEEIGRRRATLADLDGQLQQIRGRIATAEADVELSEVGIYRFRHRLDDAIAYRAQIQALRDQVRTVAGSGKAVTETTDWSLNGSAVEGRKLVKEISKLMLRAYNADVDQAVRGLRPYKLDSALAKLDDTRETISRLGRSMNIRITDAYHRLRRHELELTADYLAQVEEEKERQRHLREEQREQQKAEADYAREQERLERERQRWAETLAKLEAQGEAAKAEEVRNQVAQVDAALAGLAERRANLRLGHVYVISNLGAFGPRMVKIGMTRRLDPEDRVRELGDASVPFKFDTHAMIFSENAVALETALHQRFGGQRVNMVNVRREFYYVTPLEVRDALAEMGQQYLVHYNEDAAAEEWRQSDGASRTPAPS